VIWHADEVVGRVNLTNIARGVFQNASLSYWVDHRHISRGVAIAAVRFAVQRATHLGLHRLEAGTLTHNEPSQVVLRRSGSPSTAGLRSTWSSPALGRTTSCSNGSFTSATRRSRRPRNTRNALTPVGSKLAA
jgi:hypothetical protein